MRCAKIKLIGWLALAPWCAFSGGAVTVAELQREITAGGKLTIIDVRGTELYTQGHIPGAINIPASLCPYKNLSPLGRVVLCDGGAGRETTDAAAVALSQKPGISVDVLAGGYAAWQSSKGGNTGGRSMKADRPHYITYAELKAFRKSDIVLVDLRKKISAAPAALLAGNSSTNEPLTDLAQEFPGINTTTSPFGVQKFSIAGNSTSPLMVLIDSGDGTAQAMAKKLKGNNLMRYAILAGGEEIIARKGQAGLQRKGGTVLLMTNPKPAGTAK